MRHILQEQSPRHVGSLTGSTPRKRRQKSKRQRKTSSTNVKGAKKGSDSAAQEPESSWLAIRRRVVKQIESERHEDESRLCLAYWCERPALTPEDKEQKAGLKEHKKRAAQQGSAKRRTKGSLKDQCKKTRSGQMILHDQRELLKPKRSAEKTSRLRKDKPNNI